jgi:hypothetical protein
MVLHGCHVFLYIPDKMLPKWCLIDVNCLLYVPHQLMCYMYQQNAVKMVLNCCQMLLYIPDKMLL